MKKNLKRREFLKKAGVAGAAAVGASTLAAPAIAGGHQEWIICSAFGKAGPLGQAIQGFGDNINRYSEKLKVKVYHAGELVPGLEVLDANGEIKLSALVPSISSFKLTYLKICN